VSVDSCYLCYGPSWLRPFWVFFFFFDRGWDLNLLLLTSYQIDSIGGGPHQRANIARFSIRSHQSRTEREIHRFLQINISLLVEIY
jgi:hypothetical protein